MEKNPSFRPMPEWIKIPVPRSIHTHSFNTAETKAFHAAILFKVKCGFAHFGIKESKVFLTPAEHLLKIKPLAESCTVLLNNVEEDKIRTIAILNFENE
jgi:hypothetical protein